MSFASNKTKILELAETAGHRKPSNLGHMKSHGQETYPVSLKPSRLVKMIVSATHICVKFVPVPNRSGLI